MTAQSLLLDLVGRGVILSADGDRLDVDGPEAALTDDLLATLKARKAELLDLLAGENVEMHDSALVAEANTRKLIVELYGAGCQFWTVDGKPRLYYPPDLAADLCDRTAELIASCDQDSKTFRRLVRDECGRRIHNPVPVEVDFYDGTRLRIPQQSTPAGWTPAFYEGDDDHLQP